MIENIKNEYEPDYVSPPGETLGEILEDRGMNQVELAERTGRRTKTINQIIKGIAPITPETAIQLERVLGIPAGFWNNREARYREFLARVEENKRILASEDMVNKLPINEMIKNNWIEKSIDGIPQIKTVLGFYGIASFSQYSHYEKKLEEVYCRKASAYKSDKHSLIAWLRKGEIEAQKIETVSFDKEKFKKTILEIRGYTTMPADAFMPKIVSRCSECGVVVVYVPELSKTRICGMTRWLKPNRALIQLSFRYKTADHLWFTFFHEAGHIILHGKRDIFIDEEETFGCGEREENEANKFAADILIPHKELKNFMNTRKKAINDIQSFAKSINISPGIVVGRLQKEQYLPMSHGNKLKKFIVMNDLKE